MTYPGDLLCLVYRPKRACAACVKIHHERLTLQDVDFLPTPSIAMLISIESENALDNEGKKMPNRTCYVLTPNSITWMYLSPNDFEGSYELHV